MSSTVKIVQVLNSNLLSSKKYFDNTIVESFATLLMTCHFIFVYAFGTFIDTKLNDS